MVESSRIEVYSDPCGLADVALFVGEADVKGVVERSTFGVYSVPCGLTWGVDVVAQADMEAFALWGVINWAPRSDGDSERL